MFILLTLSPLPVLKKIRYIDFIKVLKSESITLFVLTTNKRPGTRSWKVTE